jgi:hypothetical protein
MSKKATCAHRLCAADRGKPPLRTARQRRPLSWRDTRRAWRLKRGCRAQPCGAPLKAVPDPRPLRLERGARRRRLDAGRVRDAAAPYSVPMEPPGTKSPSCAAAQAGPTHAARRASAARSTSVNTGAASYVCTLVFATQTSQSPARRAVGGRRWGAQPEGKAGPSRRCCADTRRDSIPGHAFSARGGRRMGLGECTRAHSC